MANTLNKTSDLKQALSQLDNLLQESGMGPLQPREMRTVADRLLGVIQNRQPDVLTPQANPLNLGFQGNSMFPNQAGTGRLPLRGMIPPFDRGVPVQQQGLNEFGMPTQAGGIPSMGGQGQPSPFETTLKLGPDGQLSNLILRRIQSSRRREV